VNLQLLCVGHEGAGDMTEAQIIPELPRLAAEAVRLLAAKAA